MNKHLLKTSIKSNETDAFGRVSLACLFYYFQEAANQHATSLDWGMEYLNSINKFWVLSRMFLKVEAYPLHKDEITLETWSRGADGFFAYRDYRILVDGKISLNAVSSWMILDKSTRRPIKIDQVGKEIPMINESYLPFPGNKIPAFELTEPNFEKQINYSDIDINLHVNNGKYIEIISDSLSGRLMSGSIISELDIQYLSESQINDSIAVYCQDTDALTSSLTLVNSSKSKETCKCRLKWK